MAAFIVQVVDNQCKPVQGTPVVLESLDVKQIPPVENVTDVMGYAAFDESAVCYARILIQGMSYGRYIFIPGRRILVSL